MSIPIEEVAALMDKVSALSEVQHERMFAHQVNGAEKPKMLLFHQGSWTLWIWPHGGINVEGDIDGIPFKSDLISYDGYLSYEHTKNRKLFDAIVSLMNLATTASLVDGLK